MFLFWSGIAFSSFLLSLRSYLLPLQKNRVENSLLLLFLHQLLCFLMFLISQHTGPGVLWNFGSGFPWVP